MVTGSNKATIPYQNVNLANLTPNIPAKAASHERSSSAFRRIKTFAPLNSRQSQLLLLSTTTITTTTTSVVVAVAAAAVVVVVVVVVVTCDNAGRLSLNFLGREEKERRDKKKGNF